MWSTSNLTDTHQKTRRPHKLSLIYFLRIFLNNFPTKVCYLCVMNFSAAATAAMMSVLVLAVSAALDSFLSRARRHGGE